MRRTDPAALAVLAIRGLHTARTINAFRPHMPQPDLYGCDNVNTLLCRMSQPHHHVRSPRRGWAGLVCSRWQLVLLIGLGTLCGMTAG